MKIVAAAISALFGSTFLVIGVVIPYYPSILGLGDSIGSVLSPTHSKARAAVSGLLINPESAKFYALREVDLDSAKYVCGNVDSKSRTGSYAGPRAFVYEFKSEIAAIDDSGVISRPHTGFRPCPVQRQPKIPPLWVDFGKVSRVVEALPKSDVGALSSLQPSSAGSDKPSAGQDIGQNLARLGPSQGGQNSGQPSSSSGGPSANPTSPSATGMDEKEWRGDRPPASWPKFAADDPLSNPSPHMSDAEALELASEIESRWTRFENGKSAIHPSAGEIEEALRALLAIKEQSSDFPPAWASFVRLRKIQRSVAALAARR